MDYKNTLRKYLLPAVCAVTALSANVAQAASANACTGQFKQVFFVGNNWDGTVTVIRPSGDFGKIGVVNMIPTANSGCWKFI